MFLLLSVAMIVSLFVGLVCSVAFGYDAIVHPKMSADEFTGEGVLFGVFFVLTFFVLMMNALVIN